MTTPGVSTQKANGYCVFEENVYLRAILDTTADGFCVLDRAGRFLEVNIAYCRMSGYDRAELLKLSISDVEALETPEETHERCIKLASAGHDFFESVHRRKDGTVFHVEVSSSFLDHRGGVFISFFRDISHRRAVEKDLRLKSMVLDQILDHVTVTDLEGSITYANEAQKKLFRCSGDSIVGSHVKDFGEDPAQGATQAEIITKTLSNGSWRGEVVNFDPAGQRHIMDCRTCVVLDGEGRPAALCGVATDMTDYKLKEWALRESEERSRLVSSLMMDTAYSCVLFPEENTFYIDWITGAVEGVLGYTPEEIKNLGCWGALVAPEDLQVFQKCVMSLAPGESAECELRLQRKDGNTIWVFSCARCVLSPENPEERRLYGALKDITDRKRAEAERERLQARLNQVQRLESIGRLAGGVAHDFNNMLGVIMGHAELALGQVQPEDPIKEDLEQIRQAGRRSADLTRQLLGFARRQTITPKNLDLNVTVESLLKILVRLIGEDITLKFEPGEDLSPVRIDPSQVDQILTNLCINSHDAVQTNGNITIKTANRFYDENFCVANPGYLSGRFVLLEVADDGHGIDGEVLDQIFEPFFSTKENGIGTGLGLSMVYGIVSQNGGFITVQSEPQRGTVMGVHFPAQGQNALVETKSLSPQIPLTGSGTILVVEDEAGMLKMTARSLEKMGYRVLSACSPIRALEISEAFQEAIDLLLTDVVMPGMNGKVLSEKILASRPNIGVLFMSGYSADAISPHGVLDEGVHFIQKPFVLQDLMAKVRAALGQ